MGQSESILEVEESVLPRRKLHKVVLSELTHLTKFDVTQLQRLYGNFMEENPDGTIQRDLFITRNLVCSTLFLEVSSYLSFLLFSLFSFRI